MKSAAWCAKDSTLSLPPIRNWSCISTLIESKQKELQFCTESTTPSSSQAVKLTQAVNRQLSIGKYSRPLNKSKIYLRDLCNLLAKFENLELVELIAIPPSFKNDALKEEEKPEMMVLKAKKLMDINADILKIFSKSVTFEAIEVKNSITSTNSGRSPQVANGALQNAQEASSWRWWAYLVSVQVGFDNFLYGTRKHKVLVSENTKFIFLRFQYFDAEEKKHFYCFHILKRKRNIIFWIVNVDELCRLNILFVIKKIRIEERY